LFEAWCWLGSISLVYRDFYTKNRFWRRSKVWLKKVAKLDIKKNIGARGQFAKMAVFFGLEKPLISQVMINERVQRVDNDDRKGEASNSVDIEPTLAMTGEAFDPWMVVECKSRCNQADNKIQNVKNTEEILAGSRLTTMNLLGKDSMRLKEKEADFMGTRSGKQNPILIKNPRLILVDNEKIQLKPGLHIGVVIRSEQVEAQIKIIEAGGHALGDSLV
ncbi:hypothetical protein Gohar_008604, partial [Gossypium harknessii]|nr:hypothetical protein [Gossypium harknessii]